MDKAVKTRILMENFNKYINEDWRNPTDRDVDAHDAEAIDIWIGDTIETIKSNIDSVKEISIKKKLNEILLKLKELDKINNTNYKWVMDTKTVSNYHIFFKNIIQKFEKLDFKGSPTEEIISDILSDNLLAVSRSLEFHYDNCVDKHSSEFEVNKLTEI